MKAPLVRFGIAMEEPLLTQLDAVVGERGTTRSELIRDLARAEVVREHVRRGVQSVGTLTIVYDHHVRELNDRLTDLQHELGEQVRAAMHVHLNESYCLEVIVLRGKSDKIRDVADRILSTRGVKHGGLELIADTEMLNAEPHRHVHARAKKRHGRHDDDHVHDGPRAVRAKP